jgi:hypothetical protein
MPPKQDIGANLQPLPEWLSIAAGCRVSPPVVTRPQELPFHELTWENFEKLCYRLAHQEANVEKCRLYGNPGPLKQSGIDLFARGTASTRWTVYQCKRVKNFGPTDIKDAVLEFLKGDLVTQTECFVLCTSASMRDVTRLKAVAEQEAVLKNHGIGMRVWDAEELNTRLKADHGLVADFFGQDWVPIFCGPIRENRDTIGFVHSYRPGKVPAGLRPHSGFVGRAEELATLIERLQPNATVPVSGSARVGKTAFVAESLHQGATLSELLKHTRGPREVALLYLDLKPAWGRNPVLRRLLYALGEAKRFGLEDDNAAGTLAEVEAELFSETLPTCFGTQVPLVVIDSLERIASDDRACSDVVKLLSLECLRHGVIILIGSEDVRAKEFISVHRNFRPAITLGPLKETEAVGLLAEIVRDSTMASETVRLLASDSEDLLFPLILRDGANSFLFELTARGTPRTAGALADGVLQAATQEVMAALDRSGCRWTAALGPQLPLFAMAVVATLPISLAAVNAARLPSEYFERLASTGWFHAHDKRYLLPEIARVVLRRELAAITKDQEESKLERIASAVTALMETAARQIGEDDISTFHESIEESLAWARHTQLTPDNPVRVALETALVPFVAGGVISPFSTEELSSLKGRIETTCGFSSSLSRLVMAAETDVPVADFVKAWKNAVSEAQKAPHLPPYQIRALDILGHRGTAERHLFRDIQEGRRCLLARLDTEVNQCGTTDGSLAQTVASWVVNTAHLSCGFGGDSAEVRHLCQRASALLADAPRPTRMESLHEASWIRSRLARVEADTATTLAERVAALEVAAGHAEDACVLYTAGRPNMRFYLRAVSRLLEDLPDPALRQHWLRRVEQTLERMYSAPFLHWPVSVQGLFVALQRDESELYLDPNERLASLQSVEQRLRQVLNEAHKLAQCGDGRVLLVYGRVFRQLAKTHIDLEHSSEAQKASDEAQNIAKFVLRYASSPAAWHFSLSLLEICTFGRPSVYWKAEFEDRTTSAGNVIRETVKACRDWLKRQHNRTASCGFLELKCHELIWRLEGGLHRVARRKAEADGLDYSVLPAAVRCREVAFLAIKRQQIVDGIERAYGGFVNLTLIRIHIAAQLAYNIALIRRSGKVEYDKVLDLFASAEKQFPDSNLLTAEAALFFRCVWEYGEAIDRFELVLTRCRDVHLRREVSIDLAETLLTASVHCESVLVSRGRPLQRANMLFRARDILLDTTVCGCQRSKDIAVLRDLLALELNEKLDWEKIEKTYTEIIGGLETYLPTIAENVVELRRSPGDSVDHLSDVVRTDFTHINTLRAMGKIFLRRVQLEVTDDPIRDARRAYECFDACRLLEKSVLEKETATTAFELANTILTAAQITRSVQPFPSHPEESGYPDLFSMAEAKLQSARDRSVGNFHVAVLRCQDALKMLRRELTPQKSPGGIRVSPSQST